MPIQLLPGLVDEVLENKFLNIDNIELIKNLISAAPKAQIKIKLFLKNSFKKNK